MHEAGEGQPRLAERIASVLEALRVPLLVILALTVAGAVGYLAYYQTRMTTRQQAATLAEEADRLFERWNFEQDPSKKAQLEADLRSRLDTLKRRHGGTYFAQRGMFLLAQLEAEKKDARAAFEAYLALAESRPSGYLAQEGLINAAVVAEDLGDTDKAVELYRRIVGRFPEGPHAAHARFALGRLLEAKGDYAQAAAEYMELRAKYPSSSWTSLAVNRIIALRASGKVTGD